MKSTDEMILDLVARGFKLPADLEHDVGADNPWLFRECSELGSFYISASAAHDLCAMEFARQAVGHPNDNVAWQHHLRHLLIGNSAAAIAALWEATK